MSLLFLNIDVILDENLQLHWLNLDNSHELLWDGSMCADTSRGASIRDLVGRACKGPLGPAQQEVFFYPYFHMLIISGLGCKYAWYDYGTPLLLEDISKMHGASLY
jgi:hypothetical protein